MTDVVCGWTYVLQTVLESVTRLVCNYIIQPIITILNIIEAVVTMVLTWVCTLIDIGINWLLCWTYLAEIVNNTRPRRFRVAPKIIRDNAGHSDWFVYVNNPSSGDVVDQNQQGYILSDHGRPLLPVVDNSTRDIRYFEIETEGNFITGRLKIMKGTRDQHVPGKPFLYYPYKVIEIASHLFADVFAGNATDDGTGTDFQKNLLTYNANVQSWLASDGKLDSNNYNKWSGKNTSPGSTNYFGDNSISDKGMRVDTDATCDHPTNTSLNLVNGEIEFTPPDTGITNEMTCGASQTLTFDETNFLMLNKTASSFAVTTYFVNEYAMEESSVGCNDVLGYTIITFRGSRVPLFVDNRVLKFEEDTNRMMRSIVENISSRNQDIVRVAETYLHECGHQCGLVHDSDKPDCENDTTLHIAKAMDPGGSVRRAYTRLQWCMIRLSAYITSKDLTAFQQTPDLPDSGSTP